MLEMNKGSSITLCIHDISQLTLTDKNNEGPATGPSGFGMVEARALSVGRTSDGQPYSSMTPLVRSRAPK